MFAAKDMAAVRGHDVQPKAWVLQHLLHPPAVKRCEALAKLLAHKISAGAFLARPQFVVLANVVALQALKGLHRIVQAGGGHAPGANRGAHQMHGLRGLRQPLPKNKAVQRPEDQPLGAARRTRHHADVLWLQAVLFKVAARAGAGVKAEGFEGSH